jgi:hypothetical protein
VLSGLKLVFLGPKRAQQTIAPNQQELTDLVPKPRVSLTRFHGVFAPNSKNRSHVTPAQRGKGDLSQSQDDKTPEQQHKAMTWTNA